MPFTQAAQKVAASETAAPAAPAAQETAAPEAEDAPAASQPSAPREEDPFDDIFAIFNKRR